MAFARHSVPFSAVLDCTRFNMNEYLGRPAWTDRDLEREVAVLRRASRLYPMSNWTAASLVRDCGLPEQRIRVMPPSIDLTHFGESAPTGGRPKILFVGNDFVRKGGDRLHRWVTGPLAGTCEFHIVSEDPRSHLSGDHVVHHGRVEHAELIGRLMPSMDIFCLPTRSDMSPHVLVEAAAAGLPSVASALGGIPDLILEGRTGFIVPPSDDGAFVARLQELISSPELRHEMRSAAQRQASSRFDASRNYNDLIDDLVEIARS
jgi:glycosyltransferase involved in cell wall biosynthesis